MSNYNNLIESLEKKNWKRKLKLGIVKSNTQRY
jgi:hypothetical protein